MLLFSTLLYAKTFHPTRYADYHEENRRTLHKVYGLQILIAAVGEGRKFEMFEAIISFGAIVGLFAAVSKQFHFVNFIPNKILVFRM